MCHTPSARAAVCGWFITICVLATSAFPLTPAAVAATTDLSGLWRAKRTFGPEIRGVLVVQKRGDSFIASIRGRTSAMHHNGSELRFELPDRQGSFLGHIHGGNISGHWITPDYVGYGFRYALPVRLTSAGPGLWSGLISPLDDTFTLFLMLKPAPDGSMTAVMQNPERDFGAFLGVHRMVQDGSRLTLIGKRRNWKEERPVATGSYDAENQVISLYFPDRGGTYDFQRADATSDFYPRGKNQPHYKYHAPFQVRDGWTSATLDSVNIDRAGIERFLQKIIDTPMDDANAPQPQAVLIARHRKLVLDEYFHGFSWDSLHETRSAAKSITAILLGAAMFSGAPISPSTHVYQTLSDGPISSDLDPRKRSMSLKNLMNMSSGFDCDDADPESAGNEDKMYDSDAKDYYAYALRLPMAYDPGVKAVYCTQNANLALAMLGRIKGEFQLDLFDEWVALPMHIDNYQWLIDPAGNAFGGGSVKIRPRDFLKLGQMIMDGGVWHGQRIVRRDFAAAAVAPQYHLRNVTYGYFFWSIDLPYKNRSVHAFYAGGAGGQTVVAIPELDLVIGIFAGNYSSASWRDVAMNYIPRYILPAVREPGDDRSAPVVWREDYVTPYGHSTNSGPVERSQ
jgi:CubicO group peptidase (beta-lactamase class C family)